MQNGLKARASTEDDPRPPPRQVEYSVVEGIYTVGAIGEDSVDRFIPAQLFDTQLTLQKQPYGEGRVQIVKPETDECRVEFVMESGVTALSLSPHEITTAQRGINPAMVILNREYIFKVKDRDTAQELLNALLSLQEMAVHTVF